MGKSRWEPWLGGVAVRLPMAQLAVKTPSLGCWACQGVALNLSKIGVVDVSLLLGGAQGHSLGEVRSIEGIVFKAQGQPAIEGTSSKMWVH